MEGERRPQSRLRRRLFTGGHTCPWWFVHAFDNPLRRLLQDPARILAGLVEEGQTAVDVGCGAGYFTLSLAEAVGAQGKVLALDLQPRMLEKAHSRAVRRGLEGRIELRPCEPQSLGLAEPVDFVLAFWMVHEVRNQRGFFEEIRAALRPSGRLFIAEPKAHVTRRRFDEMARQAAASGFHVTPGPRVWFSRSILCTPSDFREASGPEQPGP